MVLKGPLQTKEHLAVSVPNPVFGHTRLHAWAVKMLRQIDRTSLARRYIA